MNLTQNNKSKLKRQNTLKRKNTMTTHKEEDYRGTLNTVTLNDDTLNDDTLNDDTASSIDKSLDSLSLHLEEAMTEEKSMEDQETSLMNDEKLLDSCVSLTLDDLANSNHSEMDDSYDKNETQQQYEIQQQQQQQQQQYEHKNFDESFDNNSFVAV
mmetsp:Transcript_24592/g.28035  ORF Transcript_24592/g.28035 Transcript_24592/m.28035 type:complete len:156 (+) Transcript_24592:61-528(+)